jgi:hypothetical protein
VRHRFLFVGGHANISCFVFLLLEDQHSVAELEWLMIYGGGDVLAYINKLVNFWFDAEIF